MLANVTREVKVLLIHQKGYKGIQEKLNKLSHCEAKNSSMVLLWNSNMLSVSGASINPLFLHQNNYMIKAIISMYHTTNNNKY